jgi:hypothetical protein
MENERTYMPQLEISLTLDELRAVAKSLSIGADQMAKKINRLADDRRAADVIQEYKLLMDAKMECESVLKEAMR